MRMLFDSRTEGRLIHFRFSLARLPNKQMIILMVLNRAIRLATIITLIGDADLPCSITENNGKKEMI